MNLARAHAKARMAMKRRAEQIEDDEREAGELNLVPYLDITVNLMLFLLASVTVGFILGHINTTLPDHTPASAVGNNDPTVDPDSQNLQLVVSTTPTVMQLWSLSGLEGSIQAPLAEFPRLDRRVIDEDGTLSPPYDYLALNGKLLELVEARKDKGWFDPGKRPPDTKVIILQFDPGIPYEIVIGVMDHVREVVPDPGNPENKDDPDAGLKKKAHVGVELFPDIHFASGFE